MAWNTTLIWHNIIDKEEEGKKWKIHPKKERESRESASSSVGMPWKKKIHSGESSVLQPSLLPLARFYYYGLNDKKYAFSGGGEARRRSLINSRPYNV